MNILRTIKNWLQRDTYYEISEDFKQHRSFEFKTPNDEVLTELANRLSDLKIGRSDSFPDQNLTTENCLRFVLIDNLVSKVKEILSNDRNEIINSAEENGYLYSYKITELDLFPNAVVITNTLEYPESQETGKVIYTVVTMTRNKDAYCLWDMTEDY